VVRCYSEDTERPYFQIRYRLSMTGKELLAQALNGGPPEGARARRSSSVCTTATLPGILEHHVNGPGAGEDVQMTDAPDAKIQNRTSRTRSMGATNDTEIGVQLTDFPSQAPGTPRSNYRRGQQKRFSQNVENQNYENAASSTCDDGGMRRTMSAGNDDEFQLHRGAPPIPIASLYDKEDHLRQLREVYPQLGSEFRGLVTCLNSKNVRKYCIGQNYRKGVVIGIDEVQGKIIVFQKNMPIGTLIVMHTGDPSRYEKGYAVQDVQGRMIGTVHAIDHSQKLLVVNTSIINEAPP